MKQLSLSKIALICLLGFFANNSYARLFPEEGAVLNYRIVGFSFPSFPGASAFEIQIAQGKVSDPDKFYPRITSARSRDNHIIVEVPAFGADYTWRITYLADKNETTKSELYHFSTGSVPMVDTSQTRLRVTQKNNQDPYYIITDGANAMYDMDGNPVWYLPPQKGQPNSASDIKYTQQHTLTFLYDKDGVETDYNGKVLWKTPVLKPGVNSANQPVTGVTFHHEFSRLANGHYMALGTELAQVNANAAREKTSRAEKNSKPGAHHFFPATHCSILYEFDTSGNIIWSWRSEDYFMNADIGTLYRHMFKKLVNQGISSHENSFCFDEKKQVIYLSYATFNRIIKISYPSGKVLKTYGRSFSTPARNDTVFSFSSLSANDFLKDHIFKHSLFSGQHCCRLTRDGCLMLYNNNMHDTALPQVMIFKEQDTGALKEIWQYQCPVYGTRSTFENEGGGSEYELPDGSLFVCMSIPYGSLFIVNRNREILWSALPERKNHGEWDALQSYRATILSQSELEQLIWNSE